MPWMPTRKSGRPCGFLPLNRRNQHLFRRCERVKAARKQGEPKQCRAEQRHKVHLLVSRGRDKRERESVESVKHAPCKIEGRHARRRSAPPTPPNFRRTASVAANSQPVDMWNVGCMAYILLCGSHPFQERNIVTMFVRVAAVDYGFDSDVWTNVSDDAKVGVDHEGSVVVYRTLIQRNRTKSRTSTRIENF